MRPTATIGNDIVDRRDPHNRDSASNPRYVARVLSEPERRAHANAADPDLWLWAMWSAKEAFHKATSGHGDPTPFLPAQICIASMSTTVDTAPFVVPAGQVRRTQNNLTFAWDWDAQFVHCVVVRSGLHWHRAVVRDDALIDPATPTDAPSRRVRALVCDLAASLGLGAPDNALSVSSRQSTGRRPVLLHSAQPVEDIAISLTHDGRYAGCALAVPAGS